MRIETERLILRPFTEEDGEAYAAMAADPEVMRYFSRPLTRAQADLRRQDIMARYARDGFGYLAAHGKIENAMIGMIGIGRIPEEARAAIPSCPEVDIGWTLKRRAWRKGYATEGARACLDYAWTELGLDAVVAFTAALNRPSRRVMDKIGMARAASDDFDHPGVPEGDALRPHVLYRICQPKP